MTFGVDAARDLLKRRRYSERTVESYTQWIRRLEEYYPGEQLDELSAQQVASFFQRLSLSGRSTRQARAALRFFYQEVVKDVSRVASLPQLPPDELPRPAIPSQREIIQILGHVNDIASRAALKCIYGMGLELGDIHSVRVACVDFKKRIVKVYPQRGKHKVRFAVMPDIAVNDLRALCEGRSPTDPVFASDSSRPLSDKKIQRAWAGAKARAGVTEGYTIRSLRLAYVRQLEYFGVRLRDVLAELGVGSDRALNFYTSLHPRGEEITFSPADRIIAEPEERHEPSVDPFVSSERVSQLNDLNPKHFDLTKLLTFLREINCAQQSGSLLSIAMLCRAVIDHVAPIFGVSSFKEVANNYRGSRSFRKSMAHLDSSLRNIADSHLHQQIRAQEDIPTFTQVDFRSDMDQLLGEIVRVLRREARELVSDSKF